MENGNMGNKIHLKDKIVLIKGVEKNVDYILENKNRYIVKYPSSGKEYTYSKSNVVFKKKINVVQDKSILEKLNEYYNEGNQVEINDIRNEFILNELERGNPVKPSSFLNGNLVNQRKHYVDEKVIFPFGVNESQFKAVYMCLENQYSIIQGPPGTGKTQTILNIIANLVSNEKTVCVISSNNSAVDNIYEKLESFELGNVMANIGSKEKTKNFFSEGIKRIETSGEIHYQNQLALANEFKKMQKNFEIENQIAQLKSELHEFEIEYRHINTKLNFNEEKKETFIPFSSRNIYFFISLLQKEWLDKFFKKPNIKLIYALNEAFYKSRISEYKKAINKLTSQLDPELKGKLIKESMNLFRAKMENKLKYPENFSADTYKKNFEKFVASYPIVGTTSSSIYNTKGNGYMYDYLIIDEASQMNLYEGISSITCAKNVIVVGDELQLKPVIVGNKAININGVDANEGFLTTFANKIQGIKQIQLREHYRCDRSIINFCNMFFYENKLHIHTEFNGKTMDLVKCNSEEEVKEKAIELVENECSVISPYKGWEADTIYSYQGREAEHIYMAINKNYLTQYTRNHNLINVAVSRAKENFTLISKDYSNDNSIVGDLMKYIKYYTYDELKYDSKTLFTQLYKYNDPKLSPAEVLIRGELDKIFKENKSLDYLYEYRLSDLVDHEIDYTVDQAKFINTRSHIDFLIYNIADKTPVLAIEVDGYTYHNTSDAKRRDKLKDEILNLNDIEILRLNTKFESNEFNRIKSKINSIYS